MCPVKIRKRRPGTELRINSRMHRFNEKELLNIYIRGHTKKHIFPKDVEFTHSNIK